MPAAIVVGAGSFGASLADRLVAEGWEVTLIDRFGPGDARAESGGETRLLRFSHGGDALYTRLARRARELWLELGGVLVESGVAWLVSDPEGWEADSERVLRAEGVPVEKLDPADAAHLVPGLAPEGLHHVLHEPEAGVLRAAEGVRRLAARAVDGGARLEVGEARPEASGVRFGSRVLEADAVVWACGAWLAGLFPDLVSLRVTLQQVVLFRAGPAFAGPGWVDFAGGWYGHGAITPYGFKVASDEDGREVDPDARPREAGDDAVQRAREYLALRFPDLARAPVLGAPACHYSLTEDSNFIFAPRPAVAGHWLLGGGSGHGFKHGPAVAEHVAAVLGGRAEPEERFALGERRPGRSLRTAGPIVGRAQGSGLARRLLPLVLATTATQASIVVLAPLVVEIGDEFDASLGSVGLARSVLAATAVGVSLAIGPLIDRVGVGPLIVTGALLAMAGAGLAAASTSLPVFYATQVVTGAGVACMLSAGFAGVAAYFPPERAAWAMGWVVGSQSLAWIAGTPTIGFLAEHGSWRLAYAVPAAISGLALVAGLLAPTGRLHGSHAGPREGLLAVFRDPSARRWTLAELVAYSAWTAEITYAGAFYIKTYDLGETAVGVLLAVGSVMFLLASTNTARLAEHYPRRPLIALAALGMGTLLVPVLNVTVSVWLTLGLFCLMALCAAVRSAGSSALGLSQLPGQAGSMMAARTASAQLGYMVGAGVGGVVLELLGFGALGFVLFGGMLLSALLVLRVNDPEAAVPPARYPEPVPD